MGRPLRRGISIKLRLAVYRRDKYKCVNCGVRVIRTNNSDNPRQATLDHIIPYAFGGRETFDNLQTMCRPCNLEKRTTTEWKHLPPTDKLA